MNWFLVGVLVLLLAALVVLQEYNLRTLVKSGVNVPKSVRRVRWVNVALMLGVIAYGVWASLK